MNNHLYEESSISQQSSLIGGKDVFYKCLTCGDIVDSLPFNAAACRCQNIMIDTDGGRIAIRDYPNVLMLRRLR